MIRFLFTTVAAFLAAPNLNAAGCMGLVIYKDDQRIVILTEYRGKMIECIPKFRVLNGFVKAGNLRIRWRTVLFKDIRVNDHLFVLGGYRTDSGSVLLLNNVEKHNDPLSVLLCHFRIVKRQMGLTDYRGSRSQNLLDRIRWLP